jgi:ribosomal protein L37AE/L43A
VNPTGDNLSHPEGATGGGPRRDETIKLRAAAYRLICPACGQPHLLPRDTRFIACDCGRMIAAGAPQQRDDDRIAPAGVPVVASYRWSCPDCRKTHYERRARLTVHCAQCGATFAVDATAHEPQARLV